MMSSLKRHFSCVVESCEDIFFVLFFYLEVLDFIGHEVVESVVASLQRLLVGQTRLLKQVNHLEHVQSKKSNKKLLCTCANV